MERSASDAEREERVVDDITRRRGNFRSVGPHHLDALRERYRNACRTFGTVAAMYRRGAVLLATDHHHILATRSSADSQNAQPNPKTHVPVCPISK